MNISLRILFLSILTLIFVGCVPSPATIPTPQPPSVPSVPSIPTPTDGLPSPPSIPGAPPESESDSESSSDSESEEGSGSPSGLPSPPAPEGNDGRVLQDTDVLNGEGGPESQAESQEGGTGNSEEETDSTDVSLEDSQSTGETEPTFEENAPTFEETASSSSGGTLNQATLEELERVLEEELGTFDTTINREQRNAEEQSGEPSGGGNIPEIVFQDYPEDGEDAGGASGGGSGSGGEGTSGSGSGGNQDVSIAVEGSQIPPPNPDDDIVARQLREAAINETDPALKEKLWEEYYRYTGSQP